MNIGNKILLCRKKEGLSQEILADKLNISRQTVSCWESGESVPDAEKVILLSRMFNVSTDYLLLDDIEILPIAKETIAVMERRRHIRIVFGISMVVIGLIGIIYTMIQAGIYSAYMTEWYTEWGRYGTTLFSTWIIFPLILSVGITFTGGYILRNEYLGND